jgi:hypothetical protein
MNFSSARPRLPRFYLIKVHIVSRRRRRKRNGERVLAALDPEKRVSSGTRGARQRSLRERARTKGRIFREIRETKYGKEAAERRRTEPWPGPESKTGFYGHRSLFVFTILIVFKNRFRALVALRLRLRVDFLSPPRDFYRFRLHSSSLDGARWPHVLLIFLNYL